MSEYQGWTNQETWCVWCTLNNSRKNQELALESVKGPKPEKMLWLLCERTLNREIEQFAPWIWEEFGGLYLYKVDLLMISEALKEHRL